MTDDGNGNGNGGTISFRVKDYLARIEEKLDKLDDKVDQFQLHGSLNAQRAEKMATEAAHRLDVLEKAAWQNAETLNYHVRGHEGVSLSRRVWVPIFVGIIGLGTSVTFSIIALVR